MFEYDEWPSRGTVVEWGPGACQGGSPWDTIDFHVDIGCGNRPKGRIGMDRHHAPGVSIVGELDGMLSRRTFWASVHPGQDASIHRTACQTISCRGLPFETSSIQSIISHHFFEHIGEGFIPLVDEIYRVLVPGGILRAITPLFPCTAAVEDPDHCRYFMAHEGGGGTWDAFCGDPNTPHWTESFSVPYTTARFRKVDQILTPRVEADLHWGPHDQRELRVALEACK